MICIELDQEVRDDACLKFTYIFYLALAEGYSVKTSFEKGKMAVLTRHRSGEVNKFVPLPEKGVDHDVPLFDAEILHWKDEVKTSGSIPPGPSHFHSREVEQYDLLNLIITQRLVNLIGPDKERCMMAISVCRYIDERKNVVMSIEAVYFLQKHRRPRESTGVNANQSGYIQQLQSHLASEGGRSGAPEDDPGAQSSA